MAISLRPPSHGLSSTCLIWHSYCSEEFTCHALINRIKVRLTTASPVTMQYKMAFGHNGNFSPKIDIRFSSLHGHWTHGGQRSVNGRGRICICLASPQKKLVKTLFFSMDIFAPSKYENKSKLPRNSCHADNYFIMSRNNISMPSKFLCLLSRSRMPSEFTLTPRDWPSISATSWSCPTSGTGTNEHSPD